MSNLLVQYDESLIMHIVSLLPVDSVLQCRCVCKSWRDLIHLPFFTQNHIERRTLQQPVPDDNDPTKHSSSPVSIFHLFFNPETIHCEFHLQDFHLKYTTDEDENDDDCKLWGSHVFFSSSHNKVKVSRPLKPPPRLPSTGRPPSVNRWWLPMGSCNGLICLYGDNHIYYFNLAPVIIYNPITREYLNLPSDESQLINNVRGMVCGFGYHPWTKEYKIVRIIYQKIRPYDHNLVRWVQIYTLGGGSNSNSNGTGTGICSGKYWRTTNELVAEKELPNYNSHTGVTVNGVLYWLSDSPEIKIISFDLADEKFSTIPPPPRQPIPRVLWFDCPIFYRNELRVWNQRLSVIQRTHLSTDIWVMNNNYVWGKQFSIPGSNPYCHYDPIRLTKNGGLLCFCNNRRLISFDPRTEQIESLGDVNLFDDFYRYALGNFGNSFHRVYYTKSLVSLKGLGEEDATVIGFECQEEQQQQQQQQEHHYDGMLQYYDGLQDYYYKKRKMTSMIISLLLLSIR